MKNKILIIFLLFITLSIPSVLSQTLTIRLNSTNGMDSFIQQDKATTNFGLDNYIGIDSENSKAERGMLYFNISSIPLNSIIYNASLKLNMTAATGSTFNISVKRLTNNWVENEVTWLKQNITTNWISPGSDFSAVNYSTTEINNTLGIKTFNVTRLIEEYVNGTYQNYGFLLVAATQGGNNEKQFASIESGPNSAVLVIDYISDITPPNLTINSPRNISYGNATILINMTYSDNTAISSVWFFNGSGNETYSSPIYKTFNQGSHNLTFYVNDTLGNINSTSVSFYLDSVAPSINIINPNNNQNFNSSTISISFSANDVNLQDCMYSLNAGSNNSIECNSNFSVNANQGTNNIIIYAIDSLGNINSTSVSFYVDSVKPTIIIHSPNNQTYGNSTIFVNYSVSESSPYSCKAYIDSFLISSSCTTFTIALSNGMHNLEIYANDSFGNTNNASFSFNLDLAPPTYSSIFSNVEGSYSQNYSYFNISWQDQNIQSVIFESNFSGTDRNYSMQNLGNGKYGFGEILPAGKYYWRSYANDSFGNINYTSKIEFTINKSNYGANLYLNGNQSDVNLTYGEKVNASFQTAAGEKILYYNGLGIIGGQEFYLPAGSYNFTLIYEGNQNYSWKSISYFAYIEKAIPELELKLNGFDSDISVGVFNIVDIYAYSNKPNGAEISLYEDENLVEMNNLIALSNNYSSPGTHLFKINITESENYTSKEIIRRLDVLDENYPYYTNIHTSPSSPAIYAPNKTYQFNISWNDDIGIDEVKFQFNNVNYSYTDGQINKDGDEYYISINDLPAGNYYYKWIANDTSGNYVSSPNQQLIISKASASLIITVAPSNSVNYGELMSVYCISNNKETNPVLERNFIGINNPDNSILGVGIYNYACDGDETQNYTDPTLVSAQLNVEKAIPSIFFTINNESEDIYLDHLGGVVEAFGSLNLLYGTDADLKIFVNKKFINSSINSIFENISIIPGSDRNEITISYEGNQNYSAYNVTRAVYVARPPETSSGNGGGGGGGGGGGSIIVRPNNKTISLEFESLGDIIISPGEAKILELKVKNTGEIFLNKCKLKASQNYSNWVKSDTIKNINPGEITEYIFELITPIDANRTDDPKLILECIEKEFEVPIKTVILNSGMNIEIDNLELINDDELIINYSLIGNADFDENIVFRVYDSEENLLSEKFEKITVTSGKLKYDNLLDVSKAEKGLLKIEISKKSGGILVDEFFVYDSKQPITGLALLDRVGGNSFYLIFIVAFFVAIAFLIVRRMHSVKNIKKWEKTHAPKEKKIEKTAGKDVKWAKLEGNPSEKIDKIEKENKNESKPAFETYGGNVNKNEGWKTY